LASTSDIAKRYFAALSAHDLDVAVACWKPGSIDRFVGGQDLVAPEGVRAYFAELFAAFPDFELEVVELTTARNRTAVRWRAHGTFAGPGSFQGFAPNQVRVAIEGCDVITVADELIVHNDAYIDSGDLARRRLGRRGPADPAGQRAHQVDASGARRPDRAGGRRRLGGPRRLPDQSDERLPHPRRRRSHRV
jgi:predicted ester cyclase